MRQNANATYVPLTLFILTGFPTFDAHFKSSGWSDDEVAVFETNPHLNTCIRIRKRDEASKDLALAHAYCEHYWPLLKKLVLNE